MKIKLKLQESVSEVNAFWHPAHERHVDQFSTATEPAGLWTTKEEIVRHLAAVNASGKAIRVKEYDIFDAVESIECAEAPLEIYAETGDGEPWRHNGTLVRKIPAGAV